jgi:hypothetical protein
MKKLIPILIALNLILLKCDTDNDAIDIKILIKINQNCLYQR